MTTEKLPLTNIKEQLTQSELNALNKKLDTAIASKEGMLFGPPLNLGKSGMQNPEDIKKFLLSPAGQKEIHEMGVELRREEDIEKNRQLLIQEQIKKEEAKIVLFKILMEEKEDELKKQQAEFLAMQEKTLQEDQSAQQKLEATKPNKALEERLSSFDEAIKELEKEKEKLEAHSKELESERKSIDEKYNTWEKGIEKHKFSERNTKEEIKDRITKNEKRAADLFEKANDPKVYENPEEKRKVLDELSDINFENVGLKDLLAQKEEGKIFADENGDFTDNYKKAAFVLPKDQMVVKETKDNKDTYYLLKAKEGEDPTSMTQKEKLGKLASMSEAERAQAGQDFENEKKNIKVVLNVVKDRHNEDLDYNAKEIAQNKEELDRNTTKIAEKKTEKSMNQNKMSLTQEAQTLNQKTAPEKTSPSKDNKNEKEAPQAQDEKPKSKSKEEGKPEESKNTIDALLKGIEEMNETITNAFETAAKKGIENFKETELGKSLVELSNELSNAKERLKASAEEKWDELKSSKELQPIANKLNTIKGKVDDITNTINQGLVAGVNKATEAVQKVATETSSSKDGKNDKATQVQNEGSKAESKKKGKPEESKNTIKALEQGAEKISGMVKNSFTNALTSGSDKFLGTELGQSLLHLSKDLNVATKKLEKTAIELAYSKEFQPIVERLQTIEDKFNRIGKKIDAKVNNAAESVQKVDTETSSSKDEKNDKETPKAQNEKSKAESTELGQSLHDLSKDLKVAAKKLEKTANELVRSEEFQPIMQRLQTIEDKFNRIGNEIDAKVNNAAKAIKGIKLSSPRSSVTDPTSSAKEAFDSIKFKDTQRTPASAPTQEQPLEKESSLGLKNT